MKRSYIVIIALEERQWEWAFYQAGGRELEKIRAGVTPAPESGGTDPAAWRDALLTQWRAQRIPFAGAGLVLGLPAGDALMRIVDLPTRDQDELREMSALRIEKITPFAPDQTATASETLATREDSSRVLAAGCDAERIEALGALFREAGLKPERIDLNLCARLALLESRPAAGRAGGTERTVHLLARDDAGEMVVTDAEGPLLMRALARRENLEDAEYAAEIAAQIVYSLTACDLEHGPAGGASLILWHSGAEPLPGLVGALNSAGLEVAETRRLDDLPGLCEGLARRNRGAAGRKSLDLAPLARHLAEIAQARKRRLLAILVAAAAVWVAVVGGLYGRLRIDRLRLTGLTEEFAGLSNRYERVRIASNRVQNLAAYTDQTGSALEALREISALQPPGIDLASFDYRKGLMIRIAGEAENASRIYQFKNELDGSPLFAGTEPPSIARSARGDRETFRMSINFPAGGGAPSFHETE